MMSFTDAKTWLLLGLIALGVWYLSYFARAAWRTHRAGGRAGDPTWPTAGQAVTGFGTNFFDTLGIGSYATTTMIFRLWKMIPDERIPGTLNVGHTIPVIVQALIYTRIVPVETTTLVLMILSSVAGAWLGAGVVAGMPRRTIQVGMGGALLVAAVLMLLTQLKWLPGGGEALGLEGGWLLFAVGCNFVLGALGALRIGLYAPCMIMVSLFGMNPVAAFPIMMGSCGYLMPVASARFIAKGSFSLGAAIGLTLGGIPAVLIAAFIVKSLPLYAVRWLVVVVVLYAAVTLLAAARRERVLRSSQPATPA